MRRAGHHHRSTFLRSLVTFAILATVAVPAPVAAQADLTITTPFPSVSVQPGADVSFELSVSAAEATRVDLSVEGLPEGWTASLSGGGNEVQSVFVTPGSPAAVTLTVGVPEEAALEETKLAVVGTGGGESERLDLELIPTAEAAGTVALESDYPSLRGATDQEFQFNLTLRNDTPQQLTFGLEAIGPAGWEVSIQPSGQTAAASVTVDARGSQRLEVTAVPPFQAEASVYPILVEVVAGEHRASAELAIEVTGSVQMRLTTPDERLDTTANAGSARAFDVLIVNDGTSPLSAIDLSGRGPSEWEITFEPVVVDQLEPQGSAVATAQITPSANAVAGDYLVTLTANTEGANESIDVRVTVETPPVWGIVGAALIALTLGGMVWVFRRYGRR